jgi:hypothetical protein
MFQVATAAHVPESGPEDGRLGSVDVSAQPGGPVSCPVRSFCSVFFRCWHLLYVFVIDHAAIDEGDFAVATKGMAIAVY